MYTYGNRADHEFVFRFLYISDIESNRYEFGTDEYYFDGHNSIEVVFDGGVLSKVYYYILEKRYQGFGLTVEYNVKGNLAGSHFFIKRGLYSLDPTARYESLQAALDIALALCK